MHSLIAGSGLFHFIPVRLEPLGKNFAEQLIVFDH